MANEEQHRFDAKQQKQDEEEIIDESVEERRYQAALEAMKLMAKLQRLSLTRNSTVHYGSIDTHEYEEPENEDLRAFDISKARPGGTWIG